MFHAHVSELVVTYKGRTMHCFSGHAGVLYRVFENEAPKKSFGRVEDELSEQFRM